MNKKEENYEIVHLDWDTEEFKIKSCKVILNYNISKRELFEIQKYIIENKYKFVTVQNNNNNSINNYILGSMQNISLVDVNMQFSKKVQEVIDNNSSVIIQNNMVDDERLLDISKKSFVFSRFYFDTKLPENKYELYSNWTRNAFNKENKYFAIYRMNNIIQGFILFNIDKSESTLNIELVAVDEKIQHKGIGSTLLKKVEEFAFRNNIEILKVGTQLNNLKAQNFYIKYGFKHESIASIYHWWN